MKLLSNLRVDPSNVTLRPSGVTALLVAPTSSGKTMTTVQFTTYGAARIQYLMIGDGSATIVDRQMVYTSSLEHHMIVCVKPKDPYVGLPEFTTRITAKLVDRLTTYQRKLRTIDVSEIEAEVEQDLERVFNNTLNTKAEYSLLPEGDRRHAVRELKGPIADFLKAKGLEIFNHASNSIDVDEASKNSNKLKDAIKSKLQDFIKFDKGIQNALRQVYSSLNDALDCYFHSFFPDTALSGDGYYFYIIDVDSPSSHKDFIKAFFSNNNIQKGNSLSLEVLCDEIVIYLPIKESVKQAILADKVRRQAERSVYEDFNQDITFTLIDTQGLFHVAADEQMEQDRLRYLLYGTRYDALVCLTPMHGNPNATKFEIQMSQEMAKYKKNVPVFFLCNKTDEYADKLQKDQEASSNSFEDLFNDNKPEIGSIDIYQCVMRRADEQTRSITDALQDRKQGNVYLLPAMFKDPVNQSDKDLLAPHFGAEAVLGSIIQKISDNLALSESFIKFTYHSNKRMRQQPFEVNTEKLVHLFLNAWLRPETNSQVIQPAIANIYHNEGRNPHGNGFNALGVRLKRGEGWDSNIREDYFKNHQSFHVQFPANLRNLASPTLIAQLAEGAVDYYGDFNGGHDKIVSHSILFFNSLQYVADVLYHQIFMKHWRTLYTNNEVFQEFLRESKMIFYITQDQLHAYADYIATNGDELPVGTEHVHMLVTALQRQLENTLSAVFNRFVYVVG